MPHLELTYFDMHGGRGEPARLAMFIGGVAFEDRRISIRDFVSTRRELPFQRVPKLQIDGVVLSQGNAINRYVGKLAGLYPSDPLQAAFCDEAMEAVEDIVSQVMVTRLIQDEDERKTARAALADGPITIYLQQLQALLESHGGRYFADDRLTVADLRVMLWVRSIRKGTLDHVAADLPDTVAPRLAEHCERIENEPKVREYYARFD